MPKILARDPAWLARPSPGFHLFQPDSSNSKAQRSPDVRYEGPLRKMAHRGTEVFVAVGHELRWSDMNLLKDAGDDVQRKYGAVYAAEAPEERAYRVRNRLCWRWIALR